MSSLRARGCLFIFISLISLKSQAGVFELGAQANYRKTNFDAYHSEAMETGTASLGYYFWELSALEFSFTRGNAIQNDPEYVAYQDLTAYGVAILFTFANQSSPLKPYVKLGLSWVDKNLRYFVPTFPPIT